MKNLSKVLKNTTIYTAAFGILFLLGGFSGGKELISFSILSLVLLVLSELTATAVSYLKK
jgi:hypothetical protein